jgi:Zn-dependent protease
MAGLGQSIIDFLKQLVTWLPGLIMGVVLHEYAHGYIAYRSGDPTARNLGRLTLNPIAHIDLFGSVLLPLLLILINSGIVFGYAKPVPINPSYFRNYRRGLRYTSLAGPAANLIFAFLIGLIYGLSMVQKYWHLFFLMRQCSDFWILEGTALFSFSYLYSLAEEYSGQSYHLYLNLFTIYVYGGNILLPRE